jgi:ribosomal protein L19
LGQVAGVDIQGTQIGQDLETNITTLVDGDTIRLIRKVTQNAELALNSDQSYTVVFTQDGVTRTIKINGGTNSSISITQGSG